MPLVVEGLMLETIAASSTCRVHVTERPFKYNQLLLTLLAVTLSPRLSSNALPTHTSHIQHNANCSPSVLPAMRRTSRDDFYQLTVVNIVCLILQDVHENQSREFVSVWQLPQRTATWYIRQWSGYASDMDTSPEEKKINKILKYWQAHKFVSCLVKHFMISTSVIVDVNNGQRFLRSWLKTLRWRQKHW